MNTTTTQDSYTFSSQEAQAAWEAFAAQGACAPGTQGWWKVWGARPDHIIAGDLLLMKKDQGQGYFVDLVEDTFTAKAAPLRVGLVIAGGQVTVGALTPVVVLRQGTQNTLAG